MLGNPDYIACKNTHFSQMFNVTISQRPHQRVKSESSLSCSFERRRSSRRSLKERASRMQSGSLFSDFAEAKPLFDTKYQRPHQRVNSESLLSSSFERRRSSRHSLKEREQYRTFWSMRKPHEYRTSALFPAKIIQKMETHKQLPLFFFQNLIVKAVFISLL